jgi:carbonic anhydrase/acetyltransferase-like protein (isoleucine patch superfamily)
MAVYEWNGVAPVLHDGAWVAETAMVMGRVIMHASASVWYGATVRGDNDPVIIGENSNVQDGSVLHTDIGQPLTIGANCTIGHMVMLHGCTIGDNSLIGIGAIILNGARIGANCLVGAGTLIPEGKVIPDGSLVMGTPGKVVRELGPEAFERQKMSAAYYVQNAAKHRRTLRRID